MERRPTTSERVKRILDAPHFPMMPYEELRTGREPNVRRQHLYTPWTLDVDAFFTLRALGLPTLTAYFLTNGTNKHRTWQAISAEDGDQTRTRDLAMAMVL